MSKQPPPVADSEQADHVAAERDKFTKVSNTLSCKSIEEGKVVDPCFKQSGLWMWVPDQD